MSETQQPLLPDALQEIRQQLNMIGQRMDRIESRIGSGEEPAVTALTTLAAVSSSVAATPRPAISPSEEATPPVVAQPPSYQQFQPQAPPPLPVVPLPAIPTQSSPAQPTILQHIAATSSPPTSLSAAEQVEEKRRAAVEEQAAAPARSAESASHQNENRTTKNRAAIDWESLIGGKWALWLGSVSLFLAIASFLVYTWRLLPPTPPWARVASGLGVGLAFLIAGRCSRPRTQRWFSEGMTGAGLGIVYLSIWAGAQYFHIVPLEVAFVFMVLATVLGVYLAVNYDAPSLSVLATLGGFLTPLLLEPKGHSVHHALSLLTYVAVLNAGILAVSLFKRWRSSAWLNFVATIILVGAWYFSSYTDALRWPTFIFVTIYFIEFLGTACFYSLKRQEQTTQQDLLLLFASTTTYALVGYDLVSGVSGKFPGTFPLALALFFAFASIAARALAPRNLTLRCSAGGLALLALTIALPIQLQQSWLSIGWSAEAGVLLILGQQLGAPLLRRSGQLVWALSLLSVVFTLSTLHPTPHLLFINQRALPLLASVLIMAVVVLKTYGRRTGNQRIGSQPDEGGGQTEHDAPETQGEPAHPTHKDELAQFYAMYVVLAGAWLIAQETYLRFSWHHALTAHSWQAGALYVIASLLSIYALGAFTIGLRTQRTAILFSALMVAALSIVLPIWGSLAMPAAQWTPFWNMRWLCYVVVAATLGAMGRMISHSEENLDPAEFETLNLSSGIIALFVLTAFTIETYFGFEHWGAPSASTWQTGAFFGLAMLWSMFAALIFWMGCSRRHQGLRTLAYWIGGCGIVMLLCDAATSSGVAWEPLFNLRLLAFAVVLAMLRAGNQIWEQHAADANAARTEFSTNATLLGALLLLWGLTQETYETCRHFHALLGHHWSAAALFLITMLWYCFALTMLVAGLHYRQSRYRIMAYAVGALAGTLLLVAAGGAIQVAWLPLVNVRFIAVVVAAVILVVSAVLLGRRRAELPHDELSLLAPIGLLAALLLLMGLTQETYETCYFFHAALGMHWDRWAQMSISLAWSLYGALLLIGGINRNYQPVRLMALGLLGITALKVFLFDLSFLGSALRILSLAGLGVSLIFISWLYSRYETGPATAPPNPGV